MNNYNLSLKSSLLIFKLKPSLDVANESIPLNLFDNDSEHKLICTLLFSYYVALS